MGAEDKTIPSRPNEKLEVAFLFCFLSTSLLSTVRPFSSSSLNPDNHLHNTEPPLPFAVLFTTRNELKRRDETNERFISPLLAINDFYCILTCIIKGLHNQVYY